MAHARSKISACIISYLVRHFIRTVFASFPSPWQINSRKNRKRSILITSIMTSEVCSKHLLWLPRSRHVLEDSHGFCEISGQNKLKGLCRENVCVEKIKARHKGKYFLIVCPLLGNCLHSGAFPPYSTIILKFISKVYLFLLTAKP